MRRALVVIECHAEDLPEVIGTVQGALRQDWEKRGGTDTTPQLTGPVRATVNPVLAQAIVTSILEDS